MKLLTTLILLTFPFYAFAKPLENFKAVFDVDVYGFTVGKATQTFHCDTESKPCLLTSRAKPSGWMQRFINESAVEKITLHQTDNQLQWIQYHKSLTRRYDDRTEHKTITLKKQPKIKQITFIEQQKHWPIQDKVFDEISISYAIQHAMLNKQPLKDFYLQGDKQQQKLNIYIDETDEIIDLPFEEYLNTTLIVFKSDNIDARVWLLNDYQYFPGRIEITNKENDKTITLELLKLKR